MHNKELNNKHHVGVCYGPFNMTFKTKLIVMIFRFNTLVDLYIFQIAPSCYIGRNFLDFSPRNE